MTLLWSESTLYDAVRICCLAGLLEPSRLEPYKVHGYPNKNNIVVFFDNGGRESCKTLKGLYIRRRHRARGHIAKPPARMGLQCKLNRTCLCRTNPDDGQPAPASVRPLQRSDVHVVERSGAERRLDVRIHTLAA